MTIIKNGCGGSFKLGAAIIDQLKAELLTAINGRVCDTIKQGAKEFDLLYKIKRATAIKLITDLSNNFDTDLKNSIFNNISIEDAHYRGHEFFKEFEDFHGIVEVKNNPVPTIKTEAVYKYPMIDFDL